MAVQSNDIRLVKCTYRQYLALVNNYSSIDSHTYNPNTYTYILEPQTAMPIYIGSYSISDYLAHDVILSKFIIDPNSDDINWILSDGSYYFIYFTFQFDSTYTATSPLINMQDLNGIEGALYFRIETPTGYIKFKVYIYYNTSDQKYYLRLSDEYFTDKTYLDAVELFAIPALYIYPTPDNLLNL